MVVTQPTNPPPLPLDKHERIYTTLLAVFTFLVTLSSASNLLLLNSGYIDEVGKFGLRLAICMTTGYAAAALLTLVLRITAPAKARPITTALNIVLLIFFPLGTALGIYGLWKLRTPKAGT